MYETDFFFFFFKFIPNNPLFYFNLCMRVANGPIFRILNCEALRN